MFKARAVVIAGVVVLPALAVAGLSKMGVSLPRVFSREAIVNSEHSITADVGPQFAVAVSRAAGSTDTAEDIVETTRMREALAKIVNGDAQETVQDTTPVMTFSDQQEPAAVDHLREALGIFIKDDAELRLTQHASVMEPVAEQSNDSLMITDAEVNTAAFGDNQSIADALFPSISVNDLTGPGVKQGAQAPLVLRVANNNGGFSSDPVGSGGRRPTTFFGLDEENITSQGDTPAPGTFVLGALALVGLARRRA